ncbi:MAG: tRNA (N6-threonylcarbamoyladenosine(37)-N6)-methyltransferase TrmO [Desulfobacterales bacterium]|nr:tRNA (N6-threonylcarbamoyladenosine(37)-N6)-methyltransferase TrmO [Desulfobacterales bacterium]
MKTNSNPALYPVGLINSDIKTPFLKPGKNGIRMERTLEKVKQEVRDLKTKVSEIVLNPEFSDLLTGIDEYSHLVVLYWGHLVSGENRTITRVHPMGRKEIPKVGIFCTASPVRPNPILITIVRLVKHEGNTLKVTGLDAVDQSPVLDIKPYVKEFNPNEKTRIPKLMAQIIKTMNV